MTREEAKQQLAENEGEGWLPLVDEVFDQLPSHITITCAFNYCGSLKFDLEPRDDQFERDFLWKIYSRSKSICMKCGVPGTYAILDGWESIVCQLHFDAFEGKKFR